MTPPPTPTPCSCCGHRVRRVEIDTGVPGTTAVSVTRCVRCDTRRCRAVLQNGTICDTVDTTGSATRCSRCGSWIGLRKPPIR